MYNDYITTKIIPKGKLTFFTGVLVRNRNVFMVGRNFREFSTYLRKFIQRNNRSHPKGVLPLIFTLVPSAFCPFIYLLCVCDTSLQQNKTKHPGYSVGLNKPLECSLAFRSSMVMWLSRWIHNPVLPGFETRWQQACLKLPTVRSR